MADMDEVLATSAVRVVASWRLERRERDRAVAAPPSLDQEIAGEAAARGLDEAILTSRVETLLTADERERWLGGE